MSQISVAVEQAARLLKNARHAVVFTGAGISTPSGIPDFQSKNTGLWQRFDPMEVASIQAFRYHPEKFYGWLRPLLHEIWAAEPNPAHLGLAQLEEAGIVKAVITQNIDNLHQRAGSKNIFEVHGSLRTMSCPRCGESQPSEIFRECLSQDSFMPSCARCGQILKPDIVLYGEMLPAQVWQEAERHCQQADVILVAGSSLTVYPAAALPEIGLENEARMIINNLTPTHLDPSAEIVLRASVADIIPAIVHLTL
jgi:NAD-dependent deacetylase